MYALIIPCMNHPCRERGAKALEERLGMKKNPAEGDVEAAADGEPEK